MTVRWRHLPIVAFDTETTGLEPFGGDRVIEFAAVVLHQDDEGRIRDIEEHSFLVNPMMSIPQTVTEITGIRDSDVADAPTFDVIADRVRDLLGRGIAVAHNFPFDLAFLTKELELAGLTWPEPIAEVDTVDLSIRCFPDARSHRLSDLSKRLDVVLVDAHRATNDAKACGQAFLELARRHEVEDDLQSMLGWARAIGRPPEDGPFRVDEEGGLVFVEGPHAGSPVAQQPLYLSWMLKARVRTERGWAWRFTESTRAWVQRWLEVRGSGRGRMNPKSFRPEDWTLDSCIAIDRVTG